MKHKSKFNLIQFTRRIIQLITFLLLPWLFISIFNSIKIIYIALIHNTFLFSELLPQLLILLAVIPFTILFGRFFCGYLCSFGAMGDFFWFVSKKVNRKPVRIGEKTDRLLKFIKYALLLFLIVFVWTLGAVTINSTENPWDIFGMFVSFTSLPSASYLLTVGFGLLLLIIAGSFFIERFFCRYLCPLGAIFAVLSKIRILKVKKPVKDCGACKSCTRSCVMGIPMYRYEVINSGECINCFQCIQSCYRKNTTVNITGKDIAPLFAGIAVTAMMTGTYYVGRIASDNQLNSTGIISGIPSNAAGTQGQYLDGTYEGSGQGYKGNVIVSVTVKNGMISSIEVTSYSDDSEFFQRAKATVISDIMKSQSTDVDTVSGATYSSQGIIEAVSSALIGISGNTGSDNSNNASTPSPTQTTEPAQSNASIDAIADGTYTGTGNGFRGETKVNVTVKDGMISSIDIVSYQDDDKFFSRASSTVINNIIKSQSVNVDAVSGATYSSNGIMEAVANALNIEFTGANLNTEYNQNNKGQGNHFRN